MKKDKMNKKIKNLILSYEDYNKIERNYISYISNKNYVNKNIYINTDNHEIIKETNLNNSKYNKNISYINKENNLQNTKINKIIKPNIRTNKINSMYIFKQLSKKLKLFNHKIILLYFLLLLFLCLPKKTYEFRKLDLMNEIKLKMKGTGQKKIIYNYFFPKPDIVKVNNETLSNYSSNEDNDIYVNINNESEDVVSMIWSLENSPNTFSKLFYELIDIVNIDLSNFDTSRITDMSKMFSYCKGLKSINFGNINTSAVTNLNSMFSFCTNLKQIDFSNFDTSSVEDMGAMFDGCTNLISLDLSKFKTSLVKNMKYMFQLCENLQDLKVSNFDTTLVTSMAKMFNLCIRLEFLDLSSFQTIKTDMSDMFKSCMSLKSIKFTDKNKLGSSNLAGMFQYCYNLTSVDLSSFNTSLATNMNYMFDSCNELVFVNLSSFDTSKVVNMDNMFCNCQKLQFLDLSSFETLFVYSFSSMFYNCDSLTYLNIKSFNLNGGVYTDSMFGQNINDTLLCFNENTTNFKTKFGLKSQCNNTCFSDSNKLINDLKKCIDKCNNDDTYKYEYNNKCYTSCPDGTISSTNNQYICIQKLIDEKYCNINKSECFDELPNEYYYLLDAEQKIIDKCHENCKTCNKKGTDDNNNCLTCKENYYYYNGNCLKNCKYGSYTDDSENKICTCNSNIKCKECSDESLMEDLCISCNVGFYQKIDDNENGKGFINCYIGEINGYYFVENIYKPCYSTCKKCSTKGNDDNHYCIECIDNYVFLNESKYGYNCYQECNNYYYFESLNEYKCSESKNCPLTQSKLIKEKKKCIDECRYDDIYKYEYKNECLIKCPENTVDENYICKEIITETITEIITEIITDNITLNENTDKETSQLTQNTQTTQIELNTQNFDDIDESQTTLYTQETSILDYNTMSEVTDNIDTNNWNATKFFLGLYKDDKQSILNKDDIIKNIKKEIINHTLDTLISNIIEEKDDKYIKEGNILYQITTSENQNNNTYTNVSTIKLGECEKILKDKYNISKNETLIILKIDYNIEGLLIPIICYEVYHPTNKSKLNLSYCEESSINYNIPVTIDEDNLFKYDPNSEYYNDECNVYTTENGTDILLNDRKEEFKDNNMSLCENICNYIGYDKENKKALCECGIRYKELLVSELDKDTNLLANNFTLDSTTSNLGTMKCYDTLFSKEGLLTNIGSYILLIIIFIHLISTFIYYKCGNILIEDNIRNIINNRKKFKKSGHKFRHNKVNKTSIFKASNTKEKIRSNSIKLTKKKGKKKTKVTNPPKMLKSKKDKIISQENNSNSISLFKLKSKDNNLINSHIKKDVSLTLKNNEFNIENNKIINSQKYTDYNDFELNTMNYKDALIIDKRTFVQYYLSLIKTKHPIIFSFYHKDYNLRIIKVCLFFLSFNIYYFINALFFDFIIIHKIYEDQGYYNLSYLLPIIIYSFFISYFINIAIKLGVLSERNLIEIKNEKLMKKSNNDIYSIKRCVVIKNVAYFIISIIFLFFSWYYLSSFSAVYQNSQVYLIKNTFISFALALIYPFLINLLPGFIRIIALNNKKMECLYKANKVIQIL